MDELRELFGEPDGPSSPPLDPHSLGSWVNAYVVELSMDPSTPITGGHYDLVDGKKVVTLFVPMSGAGDYTPPPAPDDLPVTMMGMDIRAESTTSR